MVGHYKKTELDENIVILEQTTKVISCSRAVLCFTPFPTQTKATKGTTEDLLKNLNPAGGLLTGITSKVGPAEGKVGEALIESGNKLLAADSSSTFGRAVVSVGECWKEISEAQKTCNDRVMDGLIQPLKGFNEVQLLRETNKKKKQKTKDKKMIANEKGC